MNLKLVTVLFCSLIFLPCIKGLSQNPGMLQGRITDSINGQPLVGATITILLAKDSSLYKFTRTNTTGSFQVGNLAIGEYRLLVTHIGYQNFSLFFGINSASPLVYTGILSLNKEAEILSGVTVTQERAPVSVRNDTIEYNAGSFKTLPNAVVEDLLKKLPGLQVSRDGTIKANGETVKKILVDGKEFFGNDPKTASKNLPADAIDKVQVFDRKSDQAQFTGFDDGNSEKSINLSLKPEKKNGLFGRANVAAGTDQRYTTNFNVNNFSGKRQLSAIGMGNNTNKQGFSFQDILGFSGGMPGMGRSGGNVQIESSSQSIPIEGNNNQPGIQTTWAGGFNYNDFWNPKTEVGGNYFFSRISQQLNQQSHQKWAIPGEEQYITDRNTKSINTSQNHRINLLSDYAIDSANSIRFTSAANVQESNYKSSSVYGSRSESGLPINDGRSIFYNAGSGLSLANNLLFRHKFTRRGRTFSATITGNFAPSKGHGNQTSLNNFYNSKDTIKFSESILQQFTMNNHTSNYGISANYTEPLSKNALLEFSYRWMNNLHDVSKQTYDYDSLSGKFSVLNQLLSNAYNARYLVNRAGTGIRFIQNKWQVTAGAAVQYALQGGDSVFDRTYFHILPNALLQYNINKYRNLRLQYTTRTNPPDFSQLQPIINNSDPLILSKGNPALNPEYQHSLRLNYMGFDPFRQRNLFAGLSAIMIKNRIVSADFLDSSGKRLTTPVNSIGSFALNGNFNTGFPIRKLHSMISLTTAGGFGRNPGYLNQQLNQQISFQVNQGFTWNFLYKDLLDLSAEATISYFNTTYSLDKNNNNRYWKQDYSLAFSVYLRKGFSFTSDLGYIRRTGLSAGYNIDPVTWNIGVAKQVFRNKKGELRLQVYDLLNQNAGIERNGHPNYLEDLRYTVIRQYVLLGFTYSISRFAGKSLQFNEQQRQPKVITTNF